jgi:hypothetical protein
LNHLTRPPAIAICFALDPLPKLLALTPAIAHHCVAIYVLACL